MFTMRHRAPQVARRWVLAGLAAAAPLMATPGWAGSFPDGDKITIIVPFAPGGSTDTGFRLLVPGLEKYLGVPVEVENVDGGGGQIGITKFIQEAKPDGHVLVNTGLPTVLTQYADPARGAIYDRSSFAPVAQVWSGGYGFAVLKDSPIKTLDDLIRIGKEKPNEISVGDSGNMAAPHLMLAMFESKTGADFNSVHLKGGSGAQAALLGGHVDAMVGGAGDFAPLAADGKVRVLGLATTERKDSLPDVPTMGELGVDFVFETRQGLSAPAGTPPEVIAALDDAIAKSLQDPEVLKGYASYGNDPNFVDAKGFGAAWDGLDTDLLPVIKKLIAENGG